VLVDASLPPARTCPELSTFARLFMLVSVGGCDTRKALVQCLAESVSGKICAHPFKQTKIYNPVVQTNISISIPTCTCHLMTQPWQLYLIKRSFMAAVHAWGIFIAGPITFSPTLQYNSPKHRINSKLGEKKIIKLYICSKFCIFHLIYLSIKIILIVVTHKKG
jgi:hypothetical protein